MIYPLGVFRLGLTVASCEGGALVIDGAIVTAPDGWLEVPLGAAMQQAGAPPVVRVQLQASTTREGEPGIDVIALEIGDRVHRTLYGLFASPAAAWLHLLHDDVQAEILRHLDGTQRVHSGVHAAVVTPAHGLTRRR